MAVIAYIGLGANLGEREAQIRAGLAALGRVPGVRVLDVSSLRETAPVGGPPQPPYLNGVARLETALSAPALLGVCQQLERDAGRVAGGPRNGPRPLDLDLLLYGDERIDTADLIVPHPRLHERPFVLEPLRELGVEPAALPRPARPLVVADPEEFAALNTGWLHGGCRTGLVPTMGALHEGHASLLRIARQTCDRVAATIFVNPLQFGPKEDFARYPRTLERDLALLAREGADAVFVPETSAMYPGGFVSRIAVGREAEGMEGAARPDHFSGVATVVAKLFALARPTHAFFGRKDAQQVAVLRRMTRDLGFPIGLVECPTVREADGLALSSRNVYLSPEDRRAAPMLYRALRAAHAAHAAGERRAEALLAVARGHLAQEPRARLEYLELRREGDLAPLAPGPVTFARLLVVARFAADGPHPVRLLDNLSLGAPLDA